MRRRYGHRGWGDRRRPRVLDIAPGLIHESGPSRGSDWEPDHVAVMAHWSTDPVPSRSVVAILRELDSAGYATVLVSAADAAGSVLRTCDWAPGMSTLPEATTVFRRANAGYDFGSWASALAAFPGIRQAARVLLVNDSVVGPLEPLAPSLAHFSACPTPVWGLSGSLQHRPHLQSFFLGFHDGVLNHGALRAFWRDIRVEARKSKTVRYNELGLSETVDDARVDWQATFMPEDPSAANPTLDGAEHLLDQGFPFVKANAIVTQGVAERVRGWFPPGIEVQRRSQPAPLERLRYRLDVEGLPRPGIRGPVERVDPRGSRE